MSRLLRRTVALGAVFLLAGPGPGPDPGAGRLAAQEPAGATGDTIAEPAMAPTPRVFRLGATAGTLMWSGEEGMQALDDAVVLGLGIESRVSGWLGFRLDGAYGRTTLTAGDGARTDAGQYLIDVAVLPRLEIPALAGLGVVPYGAISVGTVVHDPADPDLITRSQNVWGLGGGVDIDLGGAFGLRAEWRRLHVDLEDAFDPENRDATGRTASRLWGAVYWKM